MRLEFGTGFDTLDVFIAESAMDGDHIGWHVETQYAADIVSFKGKYQRRQNRGDSCYTWNEQRAQIQASSSWNTKEMGPSFYWYFKDKLNR